MTKYILARDWVKYHLIGVYALYNQPVMAWLVSLPVRLNQPLRLVVMRKSCRALLSQL